MKKRILSFILIMSILSSLIVALPVSISAATTVWDGTVAIGFESGSGTETDPYIIKTGHQLAYLAETVNSGIAYEGEYFKLANDIVLNTPDMFIYDDNGNIIGVEDDNTPNEWTAIGNYTSSTSYKAFSGFFDGNNYAIKGLYINKPTIMCQGLFGYCQNSTIKNVGVIDGFISGNNYTGGIVGQNSDELLIENCNNSCTVLGSNDAIVGGVVGYISTDSGTKSANVINCNNDGKVIGSSNNDFGTVGGVVGYVYSFSDTDTIEIINCYNTGEVNGGRMDCGGVIGGISAINGTIKIIECYNRGSVNCGVMGTGAGILGRAYTDEGISIIENCYNAGTVTAGYIVGGIVGSNAPSNASTIKNCYNIGIIRGNTSSADVGGIVGRNAAWYGEATVIKCYNIGEVSGSGEYAGGIVGENTAAYGLSWSGTATVEKCYNAGVVNGNFDVFGGIVGSNNPYSGTGVVNVINCYNTGIIGNDSSAEIGGIVGRNSALDTSRSARVKNCYNIGILMGSGQYVGGIIGRKNGTSNTGRVDNCYYIDNCMEEGNEYGTLLNDEQMKQQSSFFGFDFSTIWTMEGKTNYPYPEIVGLGHTTPPIEYLSPLEISNGSFNFASGKGSASFDYSDNYFANSSYTYNHDLAKMSMRLALSAFAKHESDNKYGKQHSNVYDLMVQMNFRDLYKNEWYTKNPTKDSIGVAIGRKGVAYPDGDYTILAVAIRGGGYENEWGGNFIVGSEQDHEGFNTAKEQVLSEIDKYIRDYGVTGNVKLWITGYSRAGATTNLTAAYLDRNPDYFGSTVFLSPGNIYAYCLEAPAPTTDPNVSHALYKNIFSIVNQHDFVPMVAMRKWGYDRYGITKYLPSAQTNKNYYDLRNDMLDYFAQYHKSDYKVDDFTYYYTFASNKNLLKNGYGTQGVYLEKTIDKLAENIGNPSNYENEFQEMFEYIGENVVGLGKTEELANSLLDEMKSRSLLYLVEGTYLVNPNTWALAGTAYLTTRSAVKDAFENIGISVSSDAVDTLVGLIIDLGFDNVYTLLQNASGIAQGHYPELCMAWLDAIDEDDFSDKRLRTLYLNCPVDMEIYDSNNNLVAAVYDNVPQRIDGSAIVPFIDENGQKIVYLPQDEEYRIEVIATDDGEVTYSVQEQDINTGSTKIINYNNMSVKKDDTLIGTAENLKATEIATYMLSSNSVEVSEAEIFEDAEPITVETNATGNGVVSTGGEYYKGEFAEVVATPVENEEFSGWYNGETLISAEATYRFQVTEAITLTAKFTENTCEVIFLDDEDDVISTQRIAKGTTVEIPEVPEKSGYRFDGFYKDNEYTTAITKEDVYTENTTLYAKYSEPSCSNGFYYFPIDDTTAEIVGYENRDYELWIPVLLDGYTITKIADSSFKSAEFETILIPDTITVIGANAFEYCDYLETINYIGTQEQWNAIAVGENNDALVNADKVFNYSEDVVYGGFRKVDFTGSAVEGTLEFDYVYKNCVAIIEILNYYGKIEKTVEIEIPEGIEEKAFSIPFEADDEEHEIYVSFVNNTTEKTEVGEGDWDYFYAEKTYVGEEYNGVYYIMLDDETAQVEGASWSYIEIPPYVNGHRVVSIADNAFYNSGIVEILLPYTIEEIGESAFYGCDSLETINYVGSEEEWTEITIGDNNDVLNQGVGFDYPNVVSVWYNAYYENGYFKADIDISFMYKECAAFVQVFEYDINTDTLIKEECSAYFDIPINCSEYSVSIPFAANNKRYVMQMTIVDNNDHNRVLDQPLMNGFFTAQRELYNENGWVYYCYNGISEIARYEGEFAEILTIPAELGGCPVTKIAEWALYAIPGQLGNVEKIVIPSTVTHIGEGAFAMLTVKEVVIPSSVQELGMFVFDGCMNLTKIDVDPLNETYCSIDGNLYSKDKKMLIQYAIAKTDKEVAILEGTEKIGVGAIAYNESIEKAIFPSTLKEIGEGAFSLCSNLKNLDFTTNNALVHTIGNYAFIDTAFTEFNIPESVTSIGEGVFSGCANLISINVDINNTNYYSENGVLFTKDKTTLLMYPSGKDDTSYEVPDGVTIISTGAFTSCLLHTIILPKSLEVVQESAFVACDNLNMVLYEGTEEDYSKIDFGEMNYELQNANITFGYDGMPASIKSVKCWYDNNKVTAKIKFNYLEQAGTLYLAVYDEGRLVTLTDKPVTIGEIENTIEILDANDNYKDYDIKVLYWDDNSSLKPLAKFIETEIEEAILVDDVLESEHPYANDMDETKTYVYEGECISIDLTFSDDTETESEFDYIYIYDANDNQVGQYSGAELAGQTITVTGNTVKIRLTSDGSYTEYGYRTESIRVNK